MTEPVKVSPFSDLRLALDSAVARNRPEVENGAAVRVDAHRMRRTGIPELVYAANKQTEDVVDALRRLVLANGRAIATRVTGAQASEIEAALGPELEVFGHPHARALVVVRPGAERPVSGGAVGILSAGTSDIPFAAEASLIAAEMGAAVFEAWDVGVAGIHRLVEPLERLAAEGVDAVVVAAGMDGALPSVVAGLVDVPVIGLPTSIGYGFGGGGVGALTSMLQSCVPGLVVVNIDNGVGAGATAALIANRAARGRCP
jgi:NCAIR mutase (PurE)-related protein